MSHSCNVEDKLGEDVVNEIIDHVQNGLMSDQNMTDFAKRLGKLANDPEAANVLYGQHMMRMERSRNRNNSSEMMAILSDWWNHELFNMTTDDALKKLIKIFKSRDLLFKPLATKLETYLSPASTSMTAPAAPAAPVAPASPVAFQPTIILAEAATPLQSALQVHMNCKPWQKSMSQNFEFLGQLVVI